MIEFQDGKCHFSLRVAGVLRRCGHLLVQRVPEGMILPGGRIEMLEQSRSALSREMWEELGVHVEIGRMLWIVENVFDYQGAHVHQHLMIYEMSTADEIAVQRMRAEKMTWWPMEQIRRSTLFPEFLRTAVVEIPNAVEHVCLR